MSIKAPLDRSYRCAPALNFKQQYFAATHTTTVGAWGLLVQNWTNTCGTTSVSHEKS